MPYLFPSSVFSICRCVLSCLNRTEWKINDHFFIFHPLKLNRPCFYIQIKYYGNIFNHVFVVTEKRNSWWSLQPVRTAVSLTALNYKKVTFLRDIRTGSVCLSEWMLTLASKPNHPLVKAKTFSSFTYFINCSHVLWSISSLGRQVNEILLFFYLDLFRQHKTQHCSIVKRRAWTCIWYFERMQSQN